MAAGFGLVFLAQATGDGSPVSRQFLGSLTAYAGSPLFLTICSLAAFYGYAWLRGVKFGEWGCLAMLTLAVFVKPASLKLGDWSEPQLWALRTLGLLEFFVALVRVDSKRCFLGVAVSIAAFALSPDLPRSALCQQVLPYHLLLFAMLVIGVTYRDGFARFLRKAGAVMLALSCLLALRYELPEAVRFNLEFGYMSGLSLIAGVYGWFSSERWYFYSSGASLGGMLVHGSLWLWELLLNSLGPKALYPLAAGLGCFLLAAAISALKGGAGTWLMMRWKRDKLTEGVG